MKKRTRTIRILILAVLMAMGAGAIYSRMAVSRENVNGLVARALSHDASMDYIAYVTSTTQYNGKDYETYATVYHHGSTEKVEYSGPAGKRIWSMLRDGKSYTYLPKDNKLLVSETSKMLSDEEQNKLIAENYTALSDGIEKIAGHDAYVVEISSQYKGRPSKKLWIDKQHLTVLKSIDYSTTGDERGSMETTQIHYNASIPQGKFDVPSAKSVQMMMACKSSKSMELFKKLGFAVRVPKYVPAGYKLDGYHLFNSQCSCNHNSAQITYTDGLNAISVFQTSKMIACNTNGCDMGDSGDQGSCAMANCDMARTGQISAKDRTIVVVGDLLPEDVRKIAESVR